MGCLVEDIGGMEIDEEEGDCRVCGRAGYVTRFQVVDGICYLRCGRCRATFVALAHLPDRAAEHGHYLSHNNNLFDDGYRRFLSKLSQPMLLRVAPNSSGLDYGCGPGPALAQMMVEAGHDMRLYDPFFSPTLPKRAGSGKQRARASDDTPGDPLRGCYDFITCSEVVEHFHFPALEFARFDGLLGAGGWLGVMTCFQDNDARFHAWHYRKDPTHVAFYRAQTLECIAADFDWSCEIVAKDVALMRKNA